MRARINIAVNDELHTRLKVMAAKERVSLQDLAERLILRGIEAEMLDWAEKNMIDDDLRSAA